MKKFTILAALLPFVIQAQIFEETETVFKDFYYSSSHVGDFDGDGFIDIVHNGAIDSDGDGNVDTTLNEIYKNNGGTFTLSDDLGLNSTHLGDIKFIDFNNDGWLDIVSTGLSYNDIVNYQQYRFLNTGTGFELEENLAGKIYGGLEIFDFNHDGKTDYALNGTQYVEGTGFTYDVDFYQNNGNGFDISAAWLAGTQNGSFKVIDLNNDNLLDAVIFGFDADLEPIFKVYLNNEGTMEFSQDLPVMSDGKMAYADFNADGFLDLVVSGVDEDYTEYLAILWNDGTGNFTTEVIENEGLSGSSVETGDLNNDGYYDFIVMGNDADYNGWVNIFLYDSSEERFTKAEETGLFNLGSQGNIQLLDFNNDNHLDVLMAGFDWAHEDMPSLTKLFKNLSTEENQKPVAPTELNLEQEGNRLNFSWNGATDDKTPTEALQYEIKVGTISGAQDIAKYVVTTPSWFLELEEIPANVYWSVKSIDASKVYSDASDEGQLSVAENAFVNNLQIYPNPASDKVFVKADKLNSVELYDLQGRKLDVKLNSDNSINVSSLPKGVYVLKLNIDGKSVSKKLVIN
ncbi:T9SS type A sorting domain-containing protein [Moheibacter sediminis]|uniref:Por secretion system C-terminal sorting domain-containing protein n=1 Tax=Moheibacter sediminis TaxID=1434700 RepID=A0A1W1ZLN2_9FLAO|nr:T9SS type A sorting domain-containing protein [Moheibacter sediminis]SMC49153.1 Por secretion system C-terminal sorting domain-containing protein [Moheibacter sediminis]